MEHSTTAPPPWEVYRDLDPSVPLSLSSIIFYSRSFVPSAVRPWRWLEHKANSCHFPFLCWINVSLTAWMQIGWTARWSSLEERPISWASVGRKTFLFVCLPGVTLKHCFLAGLTLSIDHIFLLWHASTISFYLYSSSQVERWSTLIDVAVVLLSYSPNSLLDL